MVGDTAAAPGVGVTLGGGTAGAAELPPLPALAVGGGGEEDTVGLAPPPLEMTTSDVETSAEPPLGVLITTAGALGWAVV